MCGAARGWSGSHRWLAMLGVAACVVGDTRVAAAQPTPVAPPLLRGRVVDARSGQPLVNVLVSLPTASLGTRTDSSGGFRFSALAAGPHTLLVTAVGYEPARAQFVVFAGPPLELDVEMVPVTPQLDSVVAVASVDAPRNPAMGEFEARRAVGLGRFVTREQLLRDRGRLLDAVLTSRVAGLRVQDGVASSARAGGRIRSAGACRVNVFVDGVLVYQPLPGKDPFDLRTLEASMVAAVEFYTSASLPTEFNVASNTPCGALVIWLQH